MDIGFRTWLELAEVPAEYIKNGMVTLYRYSKEYRGPTYLIDPNKAVPSQYSRQEFRTAGMPRTFFYLNPTDREHMIGTHLYEARVPAPMIYNVLLDPLKFKEQALPDFNKLLELIRGAGYSGVYYKPPQGPIVAMFVPVEGVAVSLDDVLARKVA